MRFYINYRNGAVVTEDESGIDAEGLEEARAKAITAARELIGQAIIHNGKTVFDEVIITDESGKELLTFSAKEVLPEKLR